MIFSKKGQKIGLGQAKMEKEMGSILFNKI